MLRETHGMRYLSAGAAVALALLVGACGSSSSSSQSTVASSGTSGSSTSTSTTGTATTTASTPTGTTSTPSGPGPCRASELAISFLGQQGATGKGELGFALRNTSSQQCHTIGFPGVLFLNASGGALPTIPTRTTNDFAGPVPIHSLTVAPGDTVSFRLFVTHFTSNGSSSGCTTAAGLQVIPPNDTATLRITIPQRGAFECRTVTVSPMQPGTSAYR